jgi:hypothetical protein
MGPIRRCCPGRLHHGSLRTALRVWPRPNELLASARSRAPWRLPPASARRYVDGAMCRIEGCSEVFRSWPCVPWSLSPLRGSHPVPHSLGKVGNDAADAWFTWMIGGAAACPRQLRHPGLSLAVEQPPIPGTRRASVPDEPNRLSDSLNRECGERT